jgi:hypothetical protein
MHTYYRYSGTDPAPGSLIIKLYHSGDQVRGFIRKVTEPSEDDMVFPGEEMEPEAAFRMAENKSHGPEQHPIYVELAEGLEWDPAWGKLI